MKKSILFLFVMVASLGLFAQHAPVAVDDYFTVPLADTVVLNLVKNDYHPDSIPFRIFSQSGDIFDDSTATVYLPYDKFWNWTKNDTLFINYLLIDDNGNASTESFGKVHISIINNPFSNLDTNNVRARIIPAGLQFFSGQKPTGDTNYLHRWGYFFPKESGKSPLFSTNLWMVGTDDNDSLHVAAERYRQQGIDFRPGPVNIVNNEVSTTDSIAVAWNRVWKLSKDEIVYHKFHFTDPGYQPVEAIATWPAQGDQTLGQAPYLAPFVDVDGDGVYNPMNGDYPLIRGDQCIFFILNDAKNHTSTNGRPFGIEIHVMAYEFYNPDTLAMNNTVFYSYKIFNRSQNSYHNTKIGLYADFDIGYASDDYLGSDVQRGLIYGYNGDSIDGPGQGSQYSGTTPAQTAMILSGPLMDDDGEDNPAGECDAGINGVGFGDGIIDNERLGMARTIYLVNNSSSMNDPVIASEYNGNMNGLWKDGTAIEYGGNGHVSGGAYGPATHFVFPGTSDPCYWGTGGEEPYGPVDWTMKSSGLEPTDVRGTAITGDFTFKPGDMQRFDVAFVSAFAEDGKTALETVLDYSDIVKSKYLKDPDHFGYQYLGIHENQKTGGYNRLHVWHNPATGKVSFTYEGKSKFATYIISNISGKNIASGRIENNQTVVTDITHQPKGLYIIRVTGQHDVYLAKIIHR